LFQYYNQEFIKKIDGYWCYNGHQLAIFAAMDFAFSLKSDADYTVLVVIGLDSIGNIYILDIQRKKTNKTKEYYAMLYRAQQKWGFRKIRAEVTAAQEVIVERLKDDIRTDGLLCSVDKFRPTRGMGSKEERIQATLGPYYENNSVWHYAGGLCETLEQELIMHNPPHDDIKDALHSVFGIMKAPMGRSRMRRKTNNVITHARFGGVAA
jgi:phage terminase large subunit-like protein